VGGFLLSQRAAGGRGANIFTPEQVQARRIVNLARGLMGIRGGKSRKCETLPLRGVIASQGKQQKENEINSLLMDAPAREKAFFLARVWKRSVFSDKCSPSAMLEINLSPRRRSRIAKTKCEKSHNTSATAAAAAAAAAGEGRVFFPAASSSATMGKERGESG